MKRTTWLALVFAVVFAMQYGVAVTYAQPGPCLLDPRDGMYLVRMINLTGEQLSIAVTNDPSFVQSTYPYSAINPSSGPLNSQQNVFASTPIKLDTLLTPSNQKKYAFKGNAYWEGMINLCPIVPVDGSYFTYSGHFSQGQRLTISTVNNQNSKLNNAYIQLGYMYTTTPPAIQWGTVFDFAASTIKNAGEIAAACEDGDVIGGIKATASAIKDVAGALQTNPVTPSLNSAAVLSTTPNQTQISEFAKEKIQSYAQAIAYFSNGGNCITDYATNNQIYTLASAQQVVVKLTASDNTVRYFTAPAYYIYIKNQEAPVTGDINECTIAIIDGWVYNLAVGMYQYKGNSADLQTLNPLQMMYYAGSSVPPVPSNLTASPQPTVNLNVKTQKPITINNVAISYIGG